MKACLLAIEVFLGWRPALNVGLFVCLAIASYHCPLPFLPFLALLLFTVFNRKQLSTFYLSLLASLMGGLLAFSHQTPPAPAYHAGEFSFSIRDIQDQGPFEKLVGLVDYQVDDTHYQYRAQLVLPKGKARFAKFKLNAELKTFNGYSFLKPQKPLQLTQLHESFKEQTLFKWAKKRFLIKKRLSQAIESSSSFSEAKVAHFLSALIGACSPSKGLRFGLSRFGLSHLIAISGFHFASLVGAVFLLTRKLPPPLSWMFPLLSALCFFIYIGPSASTLRAFVMSLTLLLSPLFKRNYLATNALGIALLTCVIFDPEQVFNLGFLLSFTCCASLLLAAPRIHAWLKDGELLINWTPLTNNLAANLAAHLFAIPLLLYFQLNLPLLSIHYNLLIAPLIALCLVSTFFCLPLLFLMPLVGKFLLHFPLLLSYLALTLCDAPSSLDWSYQGSLSLTLTTVLLFSLTLAFFSQKESRPTLIN